uniref:DUF6054 family protein n=1 Tax=Agathobacter sp. TaxID=2021311 RepID=UPI004055C15D
MAKLEHTLSGNFDQLLNKIEDGILNGSMSASLEDQSDFRSGDARCSVRVFERYSYAGGNRVSLSVTLFQNGNERSACLPLRQAVARHCYSRSTLGARKHFWIS